MTITLNVYELGTLLLTAFVLALVASFYVIHRYKILVLDPNKDFTANSLELIKVLEKQLLHRDGELQLKTREIQRFVHEANHRGLNPIFKTLLGLINVLEMTARDKEQREICGMMRKQAEQGNEEEMRRVRTLEHLQE